MAGDGRERYVYVYVEPTRVRKGECNRADPSVGQVKPVRRQMDMALINSAKQAAPTYLARSGAESRPMCLGVSKPTNEAMRLDHGWDIKLLARGEGPTRVRPAGEEGVDW